jgi:hypothetical protein
MYRTVKPSFKCIGVMAIYLQPPCTPILIISCPHRSSLYFILGLGGAAANGIIVNNEELEMAASQMP